MKRDAAGRVVLMSLTLLALLAFMSATAAAADADAFQRYVLFHNELQIPIFPVVQAPQDKNCGIGGLLRIIVNDQREGKWRR